MSWTLIFALAVLFCMFCPIYPVLLRFWLGYAKNCDGSCDNLTAAPILLFFTVPLGIVVIVLYLITLYFMG